MRKRRVLARLVDEIVPEETKREDLLLDENLNELIPDEDQFNLTLGIHYELQ